MVGETASHPTDPAFGQLALRPRRAIRADAEKCESSAQDWGYRIGSQIYKAYLAGKVKPSGVRRLFLAHLDKPGSARKVCTAVIARLHSASK